MSRQFLPVQGVFDQGGLISFRALHPEVEDAGTGSVVDDVAAFAVDEVVVAAFAFVAVVVAVAAEVHGDEFATVAAVELTAQYLNNRKVKFQKKTKTHFYFFLQKPLPCQSF